MDYYCWSCYEQTKGEVRASPKIGKGLPRSRRSIWRTRWEASCVLPARAAARGGLARPRTGGAVADRENVGIAGGLQCRLDDELVDAVDLQPVEVFATLPAL